MPEPHDRRQSARLGALIAAGLAMHLLTAPAKAVENQSQRGESLRLTQRGDRACVERCINQCRATLAACEGGGNNRSVCRTQFQICARRCVVSCGGR